uniref:asparagine--tRNA ligase n=1 Tax=Octactis speculum TaxID=3111310 RepID=A0A7S2MHU0_9STRA
MFAARFGIAFRVVGRGTHHLSGRVIHHFPETRFHHLTTLKPRVRSMNLAASSTDADVTGKETAPSSDIAMGRLRVREILNAPEDEIVGKDVTIKGWVRTLRAQKTLAFIEVNDGSSRFGLQAVCEASNLENFDEVVKELSTGASVSIQGRLIESPAKGQKYELKATHVEVVGTCKGKEYPLQKKRHSLEFLREIAHLRARTNTIAAVARVRSVLAFATHEYFQDLGFHFLQSPLITASDCEGAGEMFRVTTLPSEVAKIPTTDDGMVDYKEDFFGKAAYLTVSGQLSAETYASALGDVYTFGPTFRAENSQTTRHLAEFHMIEPEIAFCDLDQSMDNAENFVKFVVSQALAKCRDDLDFFNQFYDKSLIERLQRVVNEPFARVSYREAISLLQTEISKDPSKWSFPDVVFGTDLQTEHERWLSETHFGTATFVHGYPRGIKAFYMRDNEDGETVAAMDLLVPGVGELIGGSQREERLSVLQDKMAELNLNEEDYWWYLDLRRYGSVPHSGYGLGFERLVCYVTATENIRDAIAYPRYPGHAEF